IVVALVNAVRAGAIGPSQMRRAGGSLAWNPASMSSRWKRSSEAMSVVVIGGEAARLLASTGADGLCRQLLPPLVTARRNLEDRAVLLDLAENPPPDDGCRARFQRERVLRLLR